MSADRMGLLDKPAGVTSFAALGGLKRNLGTGRIGHTGTLDRFATGLLVVLIGRYTKLADLFSDLDKTYWATIVMGKSTDTLDPEGSVVAEGPLPELGAIREAAAGLTGPIEQVPPDYSALHVQGQRAYRIARAGGTPALSARPVEIRRIEILEYRAPELHLVVDCSKGTYIRALARDLGVRAGSCAYVSALRRTRVGPYAVEEAGTIADGGAQASLELLRRIDGMRTAVIGEQAVGRIRNGQRPEPWFFQIPPHEEGTYCLLDSRGKLLAVADREPGGFRYRMVL